MGYVFYSDESGIHTKDKCYTIGALLVPESLLYEFQGFLTMLVEKHSIKSEIKWERVRNSYNVMNFAIDLLTEVIGGPYLFTCIVVLKSAHQKWQGDREEAFYTTYTLLLKHCTGELGDVVKALMDEKSESYPKHHEVVEIIANHKLKGSHGSVSKVTREDSKNSLMLQAADILTGAVNASHNLYLYPEAQIHNGKRLLIHKLAEVLGWDALHYDTYPNTGFNIWHFPWEEYRAVPETRKVSPNTNVSYVTFSDVEKLRI